MLLVLTSSYIGTFKGEVFSRATVHSTSQQSEMQNFRYKRTNLPRHAHRWTTVIKPISYHIRYVQSYQVHIPNHTKFFVYIRLALRFDLSQTRMLIEFAYKCDVTCDHDRISAVA